MELEYVSVNWVKLAELIKTRKPNTVYGYVEGIAETTGGYIYANNQIIEHKNRPQPWLYTSLVGGREIKLKMTFEDGRVEQITCETIKGNWELGEYWPKEARKILT